jgi:hypothetical protein
MGGRCKQIIKDVKDIQDKCMGIYEWNIIEEMCDLRCERVSGKLLGKIVLGDPQECVCGEGYVWQMNRLKCDAVKNS